MTSFSYGKEVAFTQEDRERLIRLEVTVATTGFAYWDRRKIIRKAKEETTLSYP